MRALSVFWLCFRASVLFNFFVRSYFCFFFYNSCIRLFRTYETYVCCWCWCTHMGTPPLKVPLEKNCWHYVIGHHWILFIKHTFYILFIITLCHFHFLTALQVINNNNQREIFSFFYVLFTFVNHFYNHLFLLITKVY